MVRSLQDVRTPAELFEKIGNGALAQGSIGKAAQQKGWSAHHAFSQQLNTKPKAAAMLIFMQTHAAIREHLRRLHQTCHSHENVLADTMTELHAYTTANQTMEMPRVTALVRAHPYLYTMGAPLTFCFSNKFAR